MRIYSRGKNHHMYGKCHSDKTKRKISESEKGKIVSKKTKEKISKSCKGRKGYWTGKHLPDNMKKRISITKTGHITSEETKQKLRKTTIYYLSHRKRKYKDTDIELLIEQELIKRNIPYLKQSPVLGMCVVDFLLPNKIVVECDGDYWHSPIRVKVKDWKKTTVMENNGYKVYRFTGTEIYESANNCIDKIILEEKGI